MKLKYVATLRSGDAITSTSIQPEGDYPVFGGNGLRGFTSRYTHEGSHVLVGRQGALCGNINYAHGKFWASEHAVVATVQGDHDYRWLGELLRSMNLNQYSQAAAQPGLAVEVISNLKIPVPPAAVQHAIADYLDAETARIDTLIAAKENLLTILAEKRRAVITQAVTRGLDPSVPMRDSGIPWLGEIPAHWDVRRVGTIGEVLVGRQRTPAHQKGKHLTPYLRVANVLDGHIDYSDVLVMNFEPREQTVFMLAAGDVLLNEDQSLELVGRSALFDGPATTYCFQNTLIRFRARPGIEPEFARYVFKAWLDAGVFQQFARRATNIAHLGGERFASMLFPIPPPAVQRAIFDFLNAETSAIDALFSANARTIALLRERRQAVIAAAVTGQLDVGA